MKNNLGKGKQQLVKLQWSECIGSAAMLAPSPSCSHPGVTQWHPLPGPLPDAIHGATG